jgi:hypothetical protein
MGTYEAFKKTTTLNYNLAFASSMIFCISLLIIGIFMIFRNIFLGASFIAISIIVFLAISWLHKHTTKS